MYYKQEICSYVMWPVVVIMGVDLADARESAMLVGLKVFASEVFAFQRLGASVRAGKLSVCDCSLYSLQHN